MILVEERGKRRTFQYASETSIAANDADELFERPV